MGKKKPKSLGVWPAVKPFANGGASGMLATCVIQPIDMIKGPTENEQIDVQGDIFMDIVEFITETWPDFDVTFPALPCSILSLDAMDISGEQHLDVKHDIVKKRLDTHGNVIEERQDGIGAPKIEKPLQKHGGRLEHNETYCGSCYGAEVSDDDCCNSCDEVRELYRKKGWALSNPDSIDQELLRMVMSSVGLEGAGDVGQRIRDEILVI